MAGARAAEQALLVSVAGERLAIAAASVAEVIRTPAVTRVPLSDPGLVGVANLRGTVIPVVSLAVLLGKDSDATSRRVVVVDHDSPVGLTVDEVSALERSDALHDGEQPVRTIDVEALLKARFGTRTKTVAPIASGVSEKREADAAEATATVAFFSFVIAGQEFGLPLAAVREVLAVPASMVVLPRTDDAMVGVVTLRNRLLPLVSLATLLGLGGATVGAGAKIVVAVIGNVRVGMIVDAAKAIVRASSDQIDPVPTVLTRGRQEAQIQAICRFDDGDRLMSILSTDHLLRDGLAERLAAESDKEDLDMAGTADSSEIEQFVIFQLADEHYGLPIDSVAEVIVMPDKLTTLPKAPKFVEGVMNLRGEIVPIIDQRGRFQAPASRSARKPKVIIVRIGKALAGFIVDGVSEVLGIAADRLRPPPLLAARDNKLIDRIANLEVDGRMILLVDPQELLDRAEQDIVAAIRETAPAGP
ncbi:chemotaxis protein CheW [Sphingomonas sp. KRR8]|uniref:chemotaxis protein CheW n=1 Tax=Sphingomonas sp. KRR8 TaxID=2942996 RepID=UPI002020A988|nr:chemotaxis protein CheW [Sphingomonas sp. KRR8]URD60776.1 chemotaxis protein CheW [Sphingomonas sp. KRR8]